MLYGICEKQKRVGRLVSDARTRSSAAVSAAADAIVQKQIPDRITGNQVGGMRILRFASLF